ncbi:MAG: FIST N-terminal domain-containing protein [Bacteroidota bacterium]
MKIEQNVWLEGKGWENEMHTPTSLEPQIVFLFGGNNALSRKECWEDVRKKYPQADIVSCSTSGEIQDTRIHDDSISLTAIRFERTRIKVQMVNLSEVKDRREAGQKLGESLAGEELCLVTVLSDGRNVNGSALVRGLNAAENKVPITGGLAGDGTRFQTTLVGLNGLPAEDNIVAIGFYGRRLKVGFGSQGGWDTFGAVRTVTRSNENILYELDGKPALDLYKHYLGEFAKNLPSAGLRFPLCIIGGGDHYDLIRTIVGVDEEQNALIFAGDIPEGAQTKLMKANTNRLVDGAVQAAAHSVTNFEGAEPEFALLISCVGRKLVLGQQAEDEVEEVREVMGPGTVMTGFYSYGEISPRSNSIDCELHNQTMTITTLSET